MVSAASPQWMLRLLQNDWEKGRSITLSLQRIPEDFRFFFPVYRKFETEKNDHREEVTLVI